MRLRAETRYEGVLNASPPHSGLFLLNSFQFPFLFMGRKFFTGILLSVQFIRGC